MNKVIITGAGGFIGGALAEQLLINNCEVYGIGRTEVSLKKLMKYSNFHPVIADFTHYEELPSIISERGFDVFYHFAWQGVFGEAFDQYDLQLNNAINSAKALEIAVKLQAKKFVMAGTSNEWEIFSIMRDSEVKPRRSCIYGASKLSAEIICKTLSGQLGIEYCAGLIAMAYGPGNRSRMLPNVVMDSFIKGVRPKLVEGNNLYDLIYIDDIVKAFIAIGEYGKKGKSYYVGHRKLKKFKEWITEIKDVLKPEVELIFGEYPEEPQLIDYSKINLDELYDDTGFECTSDFTESIIRTAEWLKSLDVNRMYLRDV